MNLNNFIANLQKLVQDHPEYGTLDVVTSSDPEGNSYHAVYYTPVAGQFNESDMEFISVEEFTEYEDEYDMDCEVNAVCVN